MSCTATMVATVGAAMSQANSGPIRTNMPVAAPAISGIRPMRSDSCPAMGANTICTAPVSRVAVKAPPTGRPSSRTA